VALVYQDPFFAVEEPMEGFDLYSEGFLKRVRPICIMPAIGWRHLNRGEKQEAIVLNKDHFR